MKRTLTALACLALACAGSAMAQTSGSDSTTTTATDHAASSSRHANKPRHATAKSSRASQSKGDVETPSGGLANPKDVAPGTYNSSGGAVPKTSDPMQTKDARDGTTLAPTQPPGGTRK
ncbi:MAG: hypothetical protein JO090_05280 [Rhizobacter sp.]|nr:hypothetical protein [Rhizobacter sp.]